MIRSRLIFLAAILLTGALRLQGGERSYLNAGLGRTFLHKPEIAKQHVDDGYNASVGVGFDFLPPLSMHVTGEYHTGSVKKPVGTWLRDDVKVKCAFMWLKLSPYLFASKLEPYVLAGVGYAYADRDKSASATTYGAGVDLWLSRSLGLFVEGRHVKTFFDEADVEGRPLRIGVIYLLRR